MQLLLDQENTQYRIAAAPHSRHRCRALFRAVTGFLDDPAPSDHLALEQFFEFS